MAFLTPSEGRHFEGLLRQLRREREAELRMLDDGLRDVREARSDGTADDEHDPDGPTLSVEWSRISGMQREVAAKTEAIDLALDRLDRGSYGLCTACGEPIGLDRLEARPAAELCIECARAAADRRR